MQVPVTLEGVYIAHKSIEYNGQNGKGISHYLALECNNAVGNLLCTKEMFDDLNKGSLEKYKNATFFGVYDTYAKNLTVEGVLG